MKSPKAIKYLFPKPHGKQLLPLLSRAYTSGRHPSGDPPTEIINDLELLRIAGIARTLADAQRIYNRYPGQPVSTIIRIEKRLRKRTSKFSRALKRFCRLFK